MSVRYTATARMEAPAVREAANPPRREPSGAISTGRGPREAAPWRDKVELRLDNRQVFFLFFGSAVVACMLFVLGVLVGKRIESRGQAEAPRLQDPLAVLDQAHQPSAAVAAGDSHELTFPSTLMPAPKAAKPVAVHASAVLPRPATSTRSPAVPSSPLAPPLPPRLAAALKAATPTPPPASVDPSKVKGKFTLQIKTFPTSEEANTFAESYPGAFVIATDIPGKGTTYRVRYGNYASFKEAAAAKESFEKQHNMLALVAAR